MSHNHYYLDKAGESTNWFHPSLLYTGTVVNDPNWFNIAHQHEFCELLYVVKGSGFATINGQKFTLNEGDLIIMNPFVLHEEQSSKENPLFLAFLGIDHFKLENLPENYLIPENASPVIPLKQYTKKIESYFTNLIYETSMRVPYYKENSQSLVNSLLILILRIILSLQDLSVPTLSQECQLIKDFIDQNYTNPLSLDTLSQKVYISKHHLSHIFKNQTGISPIKYMIEKRVETACKLLSTTDIGISDVARQVGYDDPVYFSQIFKKSMGMSPSAYRSHNKLQLL